MRSKSNPGGGKVLASRSPSICKFGTVWGSHDPATRRPAVSFPVHFHFCAAVLCLGLPFLCLCHMRATLPRNPPVHIFCRIGVSAGGCSDETSEKQAKNRGEKSASFWAQNEAPG